MKDWGRSASDVSRRRHGHFHRNLWNWIPNSLRLLGWARILDQEDPGNGRGNYIPGEQRPEEMLQRDYQERRGRSWWKKFRTRQRKEFGTVAFAVLLISMWTEPGNGKGKRGMES